MKLDKYEKLCLLKFELLFLFFKIKMAIPANFSLCQMPQPENPLYKDASVFRKTLIFLILMILETIPN
jgi:hypothetical protein